jgi:hypothetical protein
MPCCLVGMGSSAGCDLLFLNLVLEALQVRPFVKLVWEALQDVTFC